MPKAAMKKEGSAQPLSAMSYAIIALVGLVLAAGFTVFYIYKVPALINSGTEGKVFYLLLIPWALASASFLFGAMKSFASLTSKQLPHLLELGGPVVLFCLVLAGGYKLVPPAPETFDLTVRPYSADGRDPIITLGKITIDLGNDRRTASVGDKGEADFKGIPAKFKSVPLKVLPEIDGYDNKGQTLTLTANSDVLEVSLQRAAPISFKGRIDPPPANPKSIRIVVDGQKGETSADELGRFELSVNGKSGDRVRVIVYADGKPVYDDFQQLPGPVTLSLQAPQSTSTKK